MESQEASDVVKPPPVDGVHLVHVTVQPAGRLLAYRYRGLTPEVGARLVVETERGSQLAQVVSAQRPLEVGLDVEQLPWVLRAASQDDLQQLDRHPEREEKALHLCLELIALHKLEMKLIKVQYMLGGQKAVFYFTAEGRVDFRGLVKDLARELRMRIEMRQIGVRDETKMLGGVGHCGLELCCSTWLRDFVPVSIRMAKDQNLALNPQKVSGACGRLLCCLAYEHETYVALKKELPKVGKRLLTTSGPGRVVAQEILQQRVVVELDDGSRVLIGPDAILEGTPPPPPDVVPGHGEEDAPRDMRVRRYTELLSEEPGLDDDMTLPGLRAPVKLTRTQEPDDE